jgi:hypothetical protein
MARDFDDAAAWAAKNGRLRYVGEFGSPKAQVPAGHTGNFALLLEPMIQLRWSGASRCCSR